MNHFYAQIFQWTPFFLTISGDHVEEILCWLFDLVWEWTLNLKKVVSRNKKTIICASVLMKYCSKPNQLAWVIWYFEKVPCSDVPDRLTPFSGIAYTKRFTTQSQHCSWCMLKGPSCQLAKAGEGRWKNQCQLPQNHPLQPGSCQCDSVTCSALKLGRKHCLDQEQLLHLQCRQSITSTNSPVV